eukprot:CAMPEP_0204836088 /NCGR_PEP_ID=MMETSP1346-20131115/24243_1 /ASSEMBLY_ACC=CAM_ASM_000771 /TAXON_ID=215587 /ORGANISM="Aplanochytrium stocchinoi, Strain GSBS06" /LENGTH=415 /DNA_ID=CAMNT_0051970555 /DNA_START=94 /DNA_END=1338 /DNA_ORIENTATION=-
MEVNSSHYLGADEKTKEMSTAKCSYILKKPIDRLGFKFPLFVVGFLILITVGSIRAFLDNDQQLRLLGASATIISGTLLFWLSSIAYHRWQTIKPVWKVVLVIALPTLAFVGIQSFLLLMFGTQGLCKRNWIIYFPQYGACECDDRRPLLSVNDELNFTAQVPENLTIAFLGDIALESYEDVLSTVPAEGAEMLVINGDLTYGTDTEGMEKKLSQILGQDFPVFFTVGNHDTGIWTDYQEQIQKRYMRARDASTSDDIGCQGTLGVDQVCMYKGLGIVLSGIGSTCGDDKELNTNLVNALQQFEDNNVTWRNIYIHKNQHKLQTGGKDDEVGWEPYDASLAFGAIVHNSHEHTYGRTHQLSGFGPKDQDIVVAKEVDSFRDDLAIDIGPGTSHMLFHGAGGNDIRDGKNNLNKPW